MSQFLTPLIYVLAFVAVVVLVQTLAGVLFAAGDRTRRVNRRLTMLESGMPHEAVYSALVRRSAAPTFAGDRLRGLYQWVDVYCQQAGLAVTPTRLLLITAGVAGGFWLLGLTVMSLSGQGLLANGLMSLLGGCTLSVLGVWFWVKRRRDKRLKKLEEQLPLALDVINRAIRAGHPVIAAVQLAANELGDPLGSELGLIVDETTYGVEFKEALVNFAHRTGSADGHFFAVSVGIQSETGGNLAEILEGLAKVIRGRNTLAQRVKAMASEGRTSAYLLSALPPALVGFELLINPKFYTDKFSDPIFWPTVTVVLVVYGLGWVMIQRIIDIKY